MALMINEYTSAKIIKVNKARSALDLQEANTPINTNDAIDPDSLMVEIEGIHAYPHATRNFTRYMPKCLKNSVPLWTKPYRRPLIKHHNEKDGEIIGRICSVEYKTNKTLSDTPALDFTVNVPGKQAKEDVKNGILDTASIGVIAYDVRCSICGAHLETGEECEHVRGQEYTVDGKTETCYWDIYSMEPKELSYVIVPSDMYAKNIRMYPATQSGIKTTAITEGFNPHQHSINIHKGEPSMKEDNTLEKDLAEAKTKIEDLTEQVKKLTESKEKSDKLIQVLTEAKSTLEKQVKELTESNKELEDEKAEEIKLKEGAENALAEAKKESRKYMVESLQTMRQAIGKEALDEETVNSRSEDSIKDAIVDLKEEFNSAITTSKKPVPNSIQDPTLSNPDDKKRKKVKEAFKDRNTELEEGLNNIFSGVFNFRN